MSLISDNSRRGHKTLASVAGTLQQIISGKVPEHDFSTSYQVHVLLKPCPIRNKEFLFDFRNHLDRKVFVDLFLKQKIMLNIFIILACLVLSCDILFYC